MRTIWAGRMAQVTSRYADFAPVAPACCNVCRTCTTTNLIGLASAAGIGLTAAVVGFAKRIRAA